MCQYQAVQGFLSAYKTITYCRIYLCTVKALIRLCRFAGWSGSVLFAYTPWVYLFAWHDSFIFCCQQTHNVLSTNVEMTLCVCSEPRPFYVALPSRRRRNDVILTLWVFTTELLLPTMYYITKTYLYNFDPLKPHFYIVKLGFRGVYIIFLISAQKHRLWVPAEAVLTSTHNLCYEQKYEKYQIFYLKTFSFWCWNFQYIWIGVFS